MTGETGDKFGNAGAYQQYVGRWSRLIAEQFIEWLGVPQGSNWMDLGAGTGVLTEVILQHAQPAGVTAVDLSSEYIRFAQKRIHDERVQFHIANAASFAHDSPIFDAAVAGLVLNFLPDPAQGVETMRQAVKPGGTVAAYVWDYSEGMEMMRHFWDAAAEVDPASRALDSGPRFTICHPDPLRVLFEAHGLTSVDVIPIGIQQYFTDFDDYWIPFLSAQGSISGYLSGLNQNTLAAIRTQLQHQLPITEQGNLTLTSRAWAVKGSV